MRLNPHFYSHDSADRLTGWTINNTAYSADYSGNGYIVRKSDFGYVCLRQQQAARRERH